MTTLAELADQHQAHWARLIADALEAARAAVDRLELRDAIDRQRPGEIEQVLLQAWYRGGRPILEDGLAEALLALIMDAWSILEPEIADLSPGEPSLEVDWLSLGWLRWRRRYLAARLALLEAGTIEGLPEAFRLGIRGTWPTRTLTTQLQDLLGVSPVLWPTVWRYRDGLVGEPGMAARIGPLVQQRTLQLKAARAERIAAHETYQALMAVQQELWQEAVRQGTVPSRQLRRRWIIQPGACTHICEPIPRLNPSGVGVDEPFVSPIGPVMLPGATHQFCRCRVETFLLEAA